MTAGAKLLLFCELTKTFHSFLHLCVLFLQSRGRFALLFEGLLRYLHQKSMSLSLYRRVLHACCLRQRHPNIFYYEENHHYPFVVGCSHIRHVQFCHYRRKYVGRKRNKQVHCYGHSHYRGAGCLCRCARGDTSHVVNSPRLRIFFIVNRLYFAGYSPCTIPSF